jgi:hypothetical protein
MPPDEPKYLKNDLHVISDLGLILRYFSPYFYCVTNAVRDDFAYFGLFLGNLCGLQGLFAMCKLFLCPLHNIFLLNTFFFKNLMA